MEPDKEPIFGNLVYLGLVLLLFLGYITWKVYEALVVENDLFRLFATNGQGDYSFLGFLAAFLLLLAFFAIQVSNCILAPTSPNRWSISPGSSGDDPASIHWPALFGKKLPLRSIAAGTGIVIAVVAFALSGSVPLTLICIGCVLASYWLAWFFEPEGETRWLLFFVIPMSITLLFAVTGYALLVPGPYGELGVQFPGMYFPPEYPITIPGVLIIVSPVIVIFIVAWVWLNGIPFRRKLSDNEPEDYCEEEFILSLPFDKVFEICRDAVQRLPNNRIDDYNPEDGLLVAWASSGKGRASRIFFIVERISSKETRVTIKCNSPDPPAEDAPVQLTGMNRKHMRILISHIRANPKLRSQ